MPFHRATLRTARRRLPSSPPSMGKSPREKRNSASFQSEILPGRMTNPQQQLLSLVVIPSLQTYWRRNNEMAVPFSPTFHPVHFKKKRNLFRFTLRLTIGSSIENLIFALQRSRHDNLASIVDSATHNSSINCRTTVLP